MNSLVVVKPAVRFPQASRHVSTGSQLTPESVQCTDLGIHRFDIRGPLRLGLCMRRASDKDTVRCFRGYEQSDASVRGLCALGLL